MTTTNALSTRQFTRAISLATGCVLLAITIAGGAHAQDTAPTPTRTWRGAIVSGSGSTDAIPPAMAFTPAVTSTPIASIAAPADPGVPQPTTPPLSTIAATNAASGAPSGLVIPNLDASRIGIQLDANLSDEDWGEAMRRVTDNLTFKWIKLQIPWRDMQPNGATDVENVFFRRVEQHIEDASRRGLNVMVSIAKAPSWARSTTDESGPPDDPQALATFISLLLNELSAGTATDMVGTPIDAVEIWNEPNLIREWTGALPFDGAGYMQLFAPAYQAVRAYSPTLPIITAGLAPTGSNPGTVDDREFLRQMYAAGLGGYGDVIVGVHPYSWANAPDATCCGERGWDNDPHFFFANTLQEYRAIMSAGGHSAVPMWITEFGYATWDGFPGEPPAGSEWMRLNDRWAQAQYTVRAVEIAQGSASTYGVINTILWNLDFATLSGLIDNRDERIGYSLVLPGEGGVIDVNSTGFTERPLYWMLYDAVRPEVQLERYD